MTDTTQDSNSTTSRDSQPEERRDGPSDSSAGSGPFAEFDPENNPPKPIPKSLDPYYAPTLGIRIRRLFLAGLLTLAPAALTIYLLVMLFQLMDGVFAPLVDRAFSAFAPGVRVPGIGVILSLITIFLLGWLSTNMFGRRVIHWGERMVARIPVANSVYGATKGVMEALSHEQREAFKRVVLVEYPKAHLYALGFVTRSVRWSQVEARLDDILMVFVPTTPNPTSGFLLLVPRDEAVALPITVEEGIRLVISGGILLPPAEEGGPKAAPRKSEESTPEGAPKRPEPGETEPRSES